MRLLSGAGADPPPVLPLAATRKPLSPGSDRPSMRHDHRPGPRRPVLAGRGAAPLAVAIALLAVIALQPARAADDVPRARARRSSSRPGRTTPSGRGDLRRSRPATTSTASSSSSRPHGATLGDARPFRPARSSSTRPSRRTSRPIATRCTIVVPVRAGRRRVPPRSSPARAAPTRACAIRRCRARRASAWPASAAPARARVELPGRRRAAALAWASSDEHRASTAPDGDAADRRRAARRLVLAGRRRLLHRRPAALVHALRAADAADRLVDHRRPGRQRLAGVLAALARQARRPACRAPRLRLAALLVRHGASSTPRFGVAAGLAGEGLAAALQNPGCWAPSRSAWSRCRCRCSASTNCSCRRALQLPRPPRERTSFRPAGPPACSRWAASRRCIVSPCVAAPLAGALLYLSQTRDVWLGGTALFSLAAGMSVPLLSRRVGGRAAAARRRLDGRGQASSACCCSASRSGPCSRCCPARSRWRCGARCCSAARRAALRATFAARRRRAAPLLPRLAWRQAIAALLALVGVLQFVGAASGGERSAAAAGALCARASGAGASLDVPQLPAGAQRRPNSTPRCARRAAR